MCLLDWLLVPFLSVLWLEAGLCFPNGSVPMSCENMLPSHTPYSPNTSSPPFTLSTSADTYRPGQIITVTLEVKENTTAYFEGFLLQARSSSQPGLWPVGMFNNINSSLYTALKCNDKMNSAVSQATTEKRKKLQLTWEAPNNRNYGDVHFRATVIQSYSTFWMNVNSSSVRVAMSPGPPAAVMSWSLLLFSLLSLILHS